MASIKIDGDRKAMVINLSSIEDLSLIFLVDLLGSMHCDFNYSNDRTSQVMPAREMVIQLGNLTGDEVAAIAYITRRVFAMHGIEVE